MRKGYIIEMMVDTRQRRIEVVIDVRHSPPCSLKGYIFILRHAAPYFSRKTITIWRERERETEREIQEAASTHPPLRALAGFFFHTEEGLEMDSSGAAQTDHTANPLLLCL
jgi:hypothetical protein